MWFMKVSSVLHDILATEAEFKIENSALFLNINYFNFMPYL